jgi:hypothetical protein
MPPKYPGEFYDACYDLLVAEGHCRADTSNRSAFVEYFLEPEGIISNPKEFRFIGQLGFGGKFWKAHCGHYVTCYPEDRTEERAEMIRRLNLRISALETNSGYHAELRGEQRLRPNTSSIPMTVVNTG